MATISLDPVAASQRSPHGLLYRADGTWISNVAHSGSVILNYRGINRLSLLVHASGAVPASGDGVLSVIGVVGDDTAGDQAFQFAASRYHNPGAASIAYGLVTTTALTNGTSIIPDCLETTGALLTCDWTFDATGPQSPPLRFREIIVNYDKGDAADDLTFTTFALLISFSEA